MRCVDSCSVPSCGPVTILDDHLGVSNSNFGHHFPHFRIYGLDVRLSGLIVWSLYVDIGCNFFKITLHVMYTPNLAIHPVPITDTRIVRKYNINMPFCKQTEMSLSANSRYIRRCFIFFLNVREIIEEKMLSTFLNSSWEGGCVNLITLPDLAGYPRLSSVGQKTSLHVLTD